MPEGLERRYGQGHLHFITCSCSRRSPLLSSAGSRDLFVQILGEVRDRYGFALVGYVVMPKHIHLLMSEPKTGTPSTVLQVLKQRVSRESRHRPRRGASAATVSLRSAGTDQSVSQFWQSRFYDFNVWSQKQIVEKLQYMHLNPVKRGLVSHPRDWAWSSFRFYENEGSGLLRINPVQ